MAASISCGAFLTHAQGQAGVPAGEAEPMKAVSTPNRIVSSLPDPIDHEDLARYTRMLSLSQDQLQFLDFLYGDYVTAWNAVMERGFPEVDGLNGSATILVKNGMNDWTQAGACKAFFESENALREKLVVVDDEFLGKMESMLADVQRQMFWRVTGDRERQQSRCYVLKLRSVRLDLSSVVYNELFLGEEELHAVDPILVEYERLSTPLRVKVGQIARKNRGEGKETLIAQNLAPDNRVLDQTNPADRALIDEARQRHDALMAEMIEPQIELEKIQEEYVRKIAAALPASKGKALEQRYRETVWPSVWPDMTDPESMYERVATDAAIDEDVKRDMRSEWEAYRARYSVLSEKMKEDEGGHTQALATYGRDRDQRDYRNDMTQWRIERMKANLGIMRKLKSLLPSEFQQYHTQLEYQIRNAESEIKAAADDRTYPLS
ncbi:MAG TPA: hypothetical protein VG711_12305 [Phycisphaerales bacterium]|nr:hypothetical protein [Phycisphaerales bacterium]